MVRRAARGGTPRSSLPDGNRFGDSHFFMRASAWTALWNRVKFSLMSTLTLHLPDHLALELAEAGRESSRTPEAVAEEMLLRMIALQRFDRLRADVREFWPEPKPPSEDDILNEIS
jgi:hypothetical protein